MVSSSFHLLLRILLSFPSPYYYAIGLKLYLGLGVTGPHVPAGYPTSSTLDTWYHPFNLLLPGYHRL